MGRKSKLTEDQWADVGRRILDGESQRALAAEHGISETIDEQASVADPSMWKEDGGPSFIERMMGVRGGAGPRFRPADNSRVVGWSQMRARINGEGDRPLLYVTDDCLDWRRTVPACQHDKHRIEDIDTAGEDHAADDSRYACMSRPLSNVKAPVAKGPKPWTLDWVLANG